MLDAFLGDFKGYDPSIEPHSIPRGYAQKNQVDSFFVIFLLMFFYLHYYEITGTMMSFELVIEVLSDMEGWMMLLLRPIVLF